MKVVSRYCDSCGVKIPAQDIQDEIALKYEDSYYCKECKTEILPLLDKKGGKAAGAAAKGSTNGNGAAPAKKPAGDKSASGVAKAVDRKPAIAGKPAAVKPPATRSGAAPAVKRAPTASSATNRAVKGGAAPTRSGARKPVEPEEDLDGDPTDEGDAEEAPPKSKLVPILIAVAVVLVLSVIGFMATRGASTAEPEEQHAKVQTLSSKEKSEKAWSAAQASVKDRPLPERVKALNDFLQSGTITDQKVMDDAQAQVEKLEDQFKSQGEDAFKTLNAKAKELADAGSYEQAIATLRSFPPELRDTPWYTSNVRAEVAKYERNLAAKAEADPLLKKADEYAHAKEYRLAIGVLEGFDADEYRGSPYADRIDKEKRRLDEASTAEEQGASLAEIDKKKKAEEDAARTAAAEKRRAEDQKIATLKWDSIPTDDLFTWKLPPPMPQKDAWKCNGKELTGKCGDALPSMQIGAAVGVGKKSWVDYIVEFRYKVVKGSFRLGVRSLEENGGWKSVELQPDVNSDGQWHTMTVSVRGTDDEAFQQITDGVAKKIKFDAHDSTQGGIAFCLMPNSECVFTDVRVKVISKGTE